MWEQLIPTLPGKKALYSEDGETFEITIKEAKIEPPGGDWGKCGAICFTVKRADGYMFTPGAARDIIGVRSVDGKLTISTVSPYLSWDMQLLD
jgi:hypothetical protein